MHLYPQTILNQQSDRFGFCPKYFRNVRNIHAKIILSEIFVRKSEILAIFCPKFIAEI